MSNKLFFGLLVLAAGVIAGWYLLKGDTAGISKLLKPVKTPTPTASTFQAGEATVPEGTPGPSLEKGGVAARTVVTYTDSGFAPATVQITQGDTVTFVNESTRGMWVASAVHPTHQLLPGFDQLKSVGMSGTYEYTFTNAGTWKYHNHVNPQDTASVVVTE